MGGSSTLAAACSTMDNGTYMTVATYLGLSKVELGTEVQFSAGVPTHQSVRKWLWLLKWRCVVGGGGDMGGSGGGGNDGGQGDGWVYHSLVGGRGCDAPSCVLAENTKKNNRRPCVRLQ